MIKAAHTPNREELQQCGYQLKTLAQRLSDLYLKDELLMVRESELDE